MSIYINIHIYIYIYTYTTYTYTTCTCVNLYVYSHTNSLRVFTHIYHTVHECKEAEHDHQVAAASQLQNESSKISDFGDPEGGESKPAEPVLSAAQRRRKWWSAYVLKWKGQGANPQPGADLRYEYTQRERHTHACARTHIHTKLVSAGLRRPQVCIQREREREIHTHTCIHTHIRTCTSPQPCVDRRYVYTHVHTHTHTRTHTHTHTHKHKHTHTHIHTHTCICTTCYVPTSGST